MPRTINWEDRKEKSCQQASSNKWRSDCTVWSSHIRYSWHQPQDRGSSSVHRCLSLGNTGCRIAPNTLHEIPYIIQSLIITGISYAQEYFARKLWSESQKKGSKQGRHPKLGVCIQDAQVKINMIKWAHASHSFTRKENKEEEKKKESMIFTLLACCGSESIDFFSEKSIFQQLFYSHWLEGAHMPILLFYLNPD